MGGKNLVQESFAPLSLFRAFDFSATNLPSSCATHERNFINRATLSPSSAFPRVTCFSHLPHFCSSSLSEHLFRAPPPSCASRSRPASILYPARWRSRLGFCGCSPAILAVLVDSELRVEVVEQRVHFNEDVERRCGKEMRCVC